MDKWFLSATDTQTFIAVSAICLVSRNFLNIGILWYCDPLVTWPETVEAFLWPSLDFITTLLGFIISSGSSPLLSLLAPGWVFSLLCFRSICLFWFSVWYGELCTKSLTVVLDEVGTTLSPCGSPVAWQPLAVFISPVLSISSDLHSRWGSPSDLLCSYININSDTWIEGFEWRKHYSRSPLFSSFSLQTNDITLDVSSDRLNFAPTQDRRIYHYSWKEQRKIS